MAEYTSQQFIDIIWPFVKKYAKQYNILVPSCVLAQAVVESRNGNSGLAKYHNYFGMKCGSNWHGKSVNMKTKEEYQPGTLTTIKDNFRAYDSVEEGIRGYFEFLQYKRYANLKGETNYRRFCEKLKEDGYATSSTYVSTLCGTVERLGLTKYDQMINEPEVVEKIDEPMFENQSKKFLPEGISVINGELHITGKNLTEIKALVDVLDFLKDASDELLEVIKCLN